MYSQSEWSVISFVMDTLIIFITGCVGAASPEILRLYKIRNRKLGFRKSYFLISATFFVLGGFVATILPSVTVWGAYYTGLTRPLIISGTLGKPVEKSSPRSFGFPSGSKLTVRNFFWVLFG